MKKILLNKKLADNGTRHLPTIPISISIMEIISIYNLCLDVVQEYPEMVGYANICKRFSEIIKIHNTPTPKTPTEPATLDGFTPGEWAFDTDPNYVSKYRIYSTEDGRNVGWFDSDSESIEQEDANAALIAAAPRLYRENQELRRVLLLGLSFMADLNGSEWIKGDGVGEKDMRQRAKSLQQLFYDKQLNK